MTIRRRVRPEINFTRERRRVSLVRALVLLAVLGGLGVAGWQWALAQLDDSAAAPTGTWVAPYVDVTLTPILHFEDPLEQPSANVVLGFVVADPSDSCAPSWGTYYSPDAAARALDLDRRIVRLRELGGDAVVSSGGALNNELGHRLHRSHAPRRRLPVSDRPLPAHRHRLDVEGTALADTAANTRRARLPSSASNTTTRTCASGSPCRYPPRGSRPRASTSSTAPSGPASTWPALTV